MSSLQGGAEGEGRLVVEATGWDLGLNLGWYKLIKWVTAVTETPVSYLQGQTALQRKAEAILQLLGLLLKSHNGTQDTHPL